MFGGQYCSGNAAQWRSHPQTHDRTFGNTGFLQHAPSYCRDAVGDPVESRNVVCMCDRNCLKRIENLLRLGCLKILSAPTLAFCLYLRSALMPSKVVISLIRLIDK